MLRLLLARHGETDWNRERRYQGQTDVPLNEAGRRQAEALAARLAAEPISAIYASDLARAWATATVIAAAHGLPVRAEPRLREMCFGRFEGLTHDDIQAQYPDMFAAWQANRDMPPEGGETMAAFAGRVGAFLDEVTRAHDDATVLLVAHGGPLRQLICPAIGLPPEARWHLAMDNAALSELHVYREGIVLYRLNDTCHLNGTRDPR